MTIATHLLKVAQSGYLIDQKRANPEGIEYARRDEKEGKSVAVGHLSQLEDTDIIHVDNAAIRNISLHGVFGGVWGF